MTAQWVNDGDNTNGWRSNCGINGGEFTTILSVFEMNDASGNVH